MFKVDVSLQLSGGPFDSSDGHLTSSPLLLTKYRLNCKGEDKNIHCVEYIVTESINFNNSSQTNNSDKWFRIVVKFPHPPPLPTPDTGLRRAQILE